VPKDLVRSIVLSGRAVTIGGTSRELTILFSDIEGFSRKTEGMPPEVLMTDLSRYFEAMEVAISRHRGTIDKYIGDAVMAIWNAPEEDPDHAGHACRAALACRAAGKSLDATSQSKLFPVRTRFGLHCDRVVVGNVGSTGRFQYTALGGAVNLASRIEGLNKVYATDILVTQNVVDRTGGRFVFRSVDRVSPAGNSVPIEIYEIGRRSRSGRRISGCRARSPGVAGMERLLSALPRSGLGRRTRRAGGATRVVLEGAARIPLHGSVHAIYRKPTVGGLGWRADFQGKIG
jgi:adenylate cyclase